MCLFSEGQRDLSRANAVAADLVLAQCVIGRNWITISRTSGMGENEINVQLLAFKKSVSHMLTTLQNCHCNRGVTVNSVTVTGEVCIIMSG